MGVKIIAKKKKRNRVKKIIIDGIEFDSGTEAKHYEMLRDNEDIEIVERQKTFLLLDSFTYNKLPQYKKATHRKMVYTPDFIIKVKGRDKLIAMETKGHARKDYMIRKKLFSYFYKDEYDFFECKDKRDGKQLKKDIEKLVKHE